MTSRVGLIGNPIRHSLSPLLHTAAFRKLGLDAVYELWEVSHDELEAAVRRLRQPPFLGANVTIPYKETVLTLVDGRTPIVERVGAANTLYRSYEKLWAENTDVYGIAVTLDQYLNLHSVDSAVVLGAGGAAKAAVYVLATKGCRRLYLVNRSLDRAREVLDRLGPFEECGAIPWGDWTDVARAGNFDLIINATPLGREGEMPVPVALLDCFSAVFDMVYSDTPLVQTALSGGLRAVNGVPMLVYQGARSFELWFRRPAPLEAMMEAVRKAVPGAAF